MLDDGFIGTDGEDAAEGAVVELIGFVLAAVSIIFDGAQLIGAVFGIVANDVVEYINQVDDLIGMLVGDGSSEDGERRHLGEVASG